MEFKKKSFSNIFQLLINANKIFDSYYFNEWSKQVGKKNSSTLGLDMNLIPVYKVYNMTGDGVTILIIDDGVEYTHEDIASNFVS